MSRYYDPNTGTESLDETGTSIDDMPPASRKWFEADSTPAGKQWETDPTGTFPVLVDIPPPSPADLTAADRSWAESELRRTDFILLPDSPYSDEHQTLVKAYRNALRTPQRTGSPWVRPEWPAGVKNGD